MDFSATVGPLTCVLGHLCRNSSDSPLSANLLATDIAGRPKNEIQILYFVGVKSSSTKISVKILTLVSYPLFDVIFCTCLTGGNISHDKLQKQTAQTDLIPSRICHDFHLNLNRSNESQNHHVLILMYVVKTSLSANYLKISIMFLGCLDNQKDNTGRERLIRTRLIRSST